MKRSAVLVPHLKQHLDRQAALHPHFLVCSRVIMLQNSSNYISPSPFSSNCFMIVSTSSGFTSELKQSTSLISSGDSAPLLSASNNSKAYLSLSSVMSLDSSMVAITNSV